MKFRWTEKELKEVSNKKFLETLISERRCGLFNHQPLWKRLDEAEKWLNEQQE